MDDFDTTELRARLRARKADLDAWAKPTPAAWSEWLPRLEEITARATIGLAPDALKAAYDLWKAGQTPEQAARRIFGIAP